MIELIWGWNQISCAAKYTVSGCCHLSLSRWICYYDEL